MVGILWRSIAQRQLQAIVMAGVTIALMTSIASASPQTALSDYLIKDDGKFAWSLRDSADMQGVKVYDLEVTSQEWQGYVWRHQIALFVPEKTYSTDTALLFITGGSNREDGEPRWSSVYGDEAKRIAQLAVSAQAPAAVLKQIPNQPLFDDMTEDEIISYTFDQYLKTGDEDWPLLLAMVKGAVKSMDALQAFAKKELDFEIEDFVVTGGSKRGWTTWLTGASDPRVRAIMPMVIDVLNMKPQMDYQLEAWGEYSLQIQDYTQRGIQQQMDTEKGAALRRIVDPYSYIDKLTMPKLILIGCNDPYWPVDAIKFYWDDLKGEKFIHYVPNAGHGLGDGVEASKALAGFFANEVRDKKQPELTWKLIERDGQAALTVSSEYPAQGLTIWYADSSDRDFRNNLWLSRDVDADSYTETVPIPLPDKGYRAVYAAVEYASEAGGEYTMSTRMFVFSTEGFIE